MYIESCGCYWDSGTLTSVCLSHTLEYLGIFIEAFGQQVNWMKFRDTAVKAVLLSDRNPLQVNWLYLGYHLLINRRYSAIIKEDSSWGRWEQIQRVTIRHCSERKRPWNIAYLKWDVSSNLSSHSSRYPVEKIVERVGATTDIEEHQEKEVL